MKILILDAIKKGTTIHTSDGIIKYLTRFISLTLLPIHNIVVVMSPIGDQAPPALAAIIIKPAYHSFKLLSFTNFCNNVISTIVAVKLSIIAERMKAKNPKIHKILTLLLVLMTCFIPANPSK